MECYGGETRSDESCCREGCLAEVRERERERERGKKGVEVRKRNGRSEMVRRR